VRTTPTLPWGCSPTLSGEARLPARIVDVAARVNRDKLDARTRVAFETAER